MIPIGELRILIEEKYGALPYFLICTLLEWVVIILLFLDGFLAFITNQIARLFQLKTPCLLCTRFDHILVQRDSDLYYNESICDVHKKDISTLAYCHLHKRLSDIRTMCQGCLLTLHTEKDSDSDKAKLHLKPLKKDQMETSTDVLRCSCCGEPMKSKSSKQRRSLSITLPPSPPRSLNMDLPLGRHTELKLTSITDSQLQEEEDLHNYETEEANEDAPRTPTYTSRNRYFAIPLTEAAPLSPTSSSMSSNKPIDEGEDEENIARLKRQTSLDQKSLAALYKELDEERNASAVAANNAMTMITRLQAEKAAVQMEASQYQRMMEEQTEYDEEALQMMKETLLEREMELAALEEELTMYRERYGIIKKIGSEICEVDLDDDYQDMKSQALSDSDQDEHEQSMEYAEGVQDELALDYECERSHLLNLMRELERKMCSTSLSPELLRSDVGNEESEESKAALAREVSLIKERLRGIEAESGFLKQAAMTLQKGGEGIRLLTEIAQHLRKQRKNLKSPSDETHARSA